jgi:hypothetical protein
LGGSRVYPGVLDTGTLDTKGSSSLQHENGKNRDWNSYSGDAWFITKADHAYYLLNWCSEGKQFAQAPSLFSYAFTMGEFGTSIFFFPHWSLGSEIDVVWPDFTRPGQPDPHLYWPKVFIDHVKDNAQLAWDVLQDAGHKRWFSEKVLKGSSHESDE